MGVCPIPLHTHRPLGACAGQGWRQLLPPPPPQPACPPLLQPPTGGGEGVLHLLEVLGTQRHRYDSLMPGMLHRRKAAEGTGCPALWAWRSWDHWAVI